MYPAHRGGCGSGGGPGRVVGRVGRRAWWSEGDGCSQYTALGEGEGRGERKIHSLGKSESFSSLFPHLLSPWQVSPWSGATSPLSAAGLRSKIPSPRTQGVARTHLHPSMTHCLADSGSRCLTPKRLLPFCPLLLLQLPLLHHAFQHPQLSTNLISFCTSHHLIITNTYILYAFKCFYTLTLSTSPGKAGHLLLLSRARKTPLELQLGF